MKVPLIHGAVEMVPQLKSLGCPVLMTDFNMKQMILSIALKVDYIAPYFCRMLKRGLPAYETIAQMLVVKASSGNTTRILMASLRNTEQLC